MADLENAPNGLILEWNDLKQLAGEFDQIINGTIVGYRNSDALTQIRLQSDLQSSCDLVIEAIDSSLWRVYSRDEKVLHKLRVAFHDVKTI